MMAHGALYWTEGNGYSAEWVVEAKNNGARIFHVDPRFTRTSALAHRHVPLRAGSDIAFLGGIVNHILENGRDFREYVVNLLLERYVSIQK